MPRANGQSSGRRHLLRTVAWWGLGGAAAWLLLAVGGSLLLGPGGHPPASALLLPALALPSVSFRIGVGLGLSWLADISVFLAAPLEWALLAAALGLLIRGPGPLHSAPPHSRLAPTVSNPRLLGLGVWVFYILTLVVPWLLIELPLAARWAIRSEGGAVRTRAVETLARSGRPGDVPLLAAVLENNNGNYRQLRGAACGMTRWGGLAAWRRWAASPGGAENLPLCVWTAVDVLESPAGCPGPPIEISAEERDELRVELVHQVVAGQLTNSQVGDRYPGLLLLHDQIPPADRDLYLPVMVESLGDPFWLHRAASLRLLLEVREGRPIPETVPWEELGEVDPESATTAEVEECRERWSEWLEQRRSAPGSEAATVPRVQGP